MKPEVVQHLLAYQAWANERVLAAIRELAPDEYQRSFALQRPLSTEETTRNYGEPFPGSVASILPHLVWADHLWLQRWRGEMTAPTPPQTLEALETHWREVQHERMEWAKSLTEAQLLGPLAYQNTKGESFVNPLWVLIMQACNHATEHRAHLAVLLAQLGHPTEALDLITFHRAYPEA